MSSTGKIQDQRCLVVGAGYMGRAHLDALIRLKTCAIGVFAPSEKNRAVAEQLGAPFFSGRLARAIEQFKPTHAIVASPVDTLSAVAGELVDRGVTSILVEKPFALDTTAANILLRKAREAGARVRVAYNRRCYASVLTARRMIERSGEPITSVFFEFTEWSQIIGPDERLTPQIKDHWLVANSTHVIDLALSQVGMPEISRSSFVVAGSLPWHRCGSRFAGCGLTAAGVLFSYVANWDGPGRWGVEWITPSTRYIFRPLEKLHVMKRGSIAIEEVTLDNELEQQLKPGVYVQAHEFLRGDPHNELVSLERGIELIELAHTIGRYRSPVTV